MGKIFVGVTPGTLCNVRRDRNGCPPHLRSHGVKLVIGQVASQPINLLVQGSRGLPHVQPFKAESRLHNGSILSQGFVPRTGVVVLRASDVEPVAVQPLIAELFLPSTLDFRKCPRPSTLDTRPPEMVA